jgi:SET and MYND domain-containing protein
MRDTSGMIETLCQLQCNTFSLCDVELQPIGAGLYPRLSFFNHSCVPCTPP